MPHITLQLGLVPNFSHSPSISCVVDTTTALCVGNYHFFAAIAKRYPHCVAKIFLPEDYSPIILLGIFQDNVHSVATLIYWWHSSFTCHISPKNGSTASFVVATRPHVSVNTVLGLPLITATGMIIDTVDGDNVVDAKYLDCPPFPIDFLPHNKNSPCN